jgi:hypothetical protein
MIRYYLSGEDRVMDNEALNTLLLNSEGKNYWVVLWGHPERSPDEEELFFNDPVIEHWFPMNPASITPGDILFVHRIKVSTLIFVAEVISFPKKDSRRERWQWSVDTRNLTRTFGEHWRKYSLRTFSLGREYNALHPHDQVKLGRLNFGAPARISRGFAQFLLNQIIGL